MVKPRRHPSAAVNQPAPAAAAAAAPVRPVTDHVPVVASPPSPGHRQEWPGAASHERPPIASASPSGSGASSSGDSFYEWAQPACLATVGPQASGVDLGGMVFDLGFSVDDAAPTDAPSSAHLIETLPTPPFPVDPLPSPAALDTSNSTGANPATSLLGLVPRSLSLIPDVGGASLELLSHYLSVTTRSMDNGSTPDNPFIVQLVPLAFSSDLVLQLLLTQSAVHRASRLLPDTADIASQHYSQSLRLFQRSISHYNSEQSVESLTLTVGALIMCFVETAKGDRNGTVFDHLMAAQWLLQAFLAQKSIVPKGLRDFLIEYYVYTSTLSMVSIDCRVSPQCLLGDDLAAHGRALAQAGYLGSLCGCWLELLLVIPAIFNIGRRFLSAEAEADPLAQPATADDFALFAQVHHQIQSWAPDASVRPDVALAGRLFQQAMVVYLYTALNSLTTTTTATTNTTNNNEGSPHHTLVVQTAVAEALSYLAQIPPAARINTSLCWPIAVVGSCAVREEQRSFIRTRLDVMFKAIGLGNISQTAMLLDRVWESPPPGPWNICRVMQEHQIWISFA
ncbi:C6 transcription factor [Niveomyces insectorum RCEF 264]|uniref:C6 transcription factor n=1 Tax=Niveomyces insectorum RCEF 264 TaxID=1081102 RepID=A0A167XAQ6_9HYPO|nr:C6 transcription factor [Niveomyces insectorum RCEF 264]